MSSQVNVQLQSQVQVLNPQQLLVSELVEMPAEALYERVDRELQENVSLEADHSETSDYADGPKSQFLEQMLSGGQRWNPQLRGALRGLNCGERVSGL